MGAAFTYAVIYGVTAECRTPLRTGEADGDVGEVLRDASGCAFLQGTSLAGALRGWLENNFPQTVEALFGSQRQAGRLIVSDGLFSRDAEQYVRPRLRINGASGTADSGRRFYMAHIGAGAKLTFTLTWLGMREESAQLEAVEQMLAALDCGEIRLGAQKTNGFGRVSLTVEKRTFDLSDVRDRMAWLEGRTDGSPLVLPGLEAAQKVAFVLTGKADNLLVRSAVRESADGEEYTVNIRESGLPILPGSSVKGTVRAQAERIIHTVGADFSVEELFGRGAENGGNGGQGRIWFEDIRLDGSRSKKIIRIRINKFTGGVIRQAMIKEEPLSAPIKLCVRVPDEPLACALILYALRDLGLGLYNLGSGGSVGRGYVAVDAIEADAPKGRHMALKFKNGAVSSLDDPDGLAAEWLSAWGGVRRAH